MRFFILLLSLSFLTPTATAQQGRSAKKWYEGGTLHKKSALDWQHADAADKLATCGDFIASMWDKKEFRSDIQKSIESLDDMKPYAEKLVVYLDAAMKKDTDDKKNRQLYTNLKVSEASAIGMVMMQWMKK